MRILPHVFLSALLFCGCATHNDTKNTTRQSDIPQDNIYSATISKNTAMKVYIDLRERHRCSRISPEIEIFNAPVDTAFYDITLEDTVDTRRMHGGGVWQHDGTGIVPEGVLMRHYRGACPPVNTKRMYQYVIKALDVNKRTLAIRTYSFEQE